jgi:hypothetical protein
MTNTTKIASALAAIGLQIALAGTSVAAAPDLRPIVLNASSGRIKLGEEKQLCHRLRIPRRQETEVNRIEMLVKGGSHHVHLYRPYGGPPDWPTHDCPYAVDFNKWQLVSATQNKALDWKLHPGVGILFAPREPVLIQTHFVNVGALTTQGTARAKITLHPADPTTIKMHGGALFAQDRALVVPPGTSTVANRCQLTGDASENRTLTIMAFTGHYHFRGVRFEVQRVRADGSLGEMLYEHDGYDDPSFQQYPVDPALVIHPGEGFEWRCTYQNDSDTTYWFGPNTQMNEHCNLFGFYYPTEVPQEAIDCIHKRDDAGNELNLRVVAH